MTQKEIIYKYLEQANDWVSSYNLIKQETDFGWLGSGSDRIARYMVKDGIIERKEDGKYAYYRIKQENTLFKLPPILSI